MDTASAKQFAVLWAGAQPALFAFVRSVTHDFQQAEEIMQRVAVTLVEKFDVYDASRPFVAWAIGVAKYEVLSFRRERSTDRHLFDDDLVEKISLGYQRFAADADPFREALEHCMNQVERRGRQAVELRYARGLGFAAVAEEMNMNAGAARMLLCRVRQLLRQCIERRLQGVGRP